MLALPTVLNGRKKVKQAEAELGQAQPQFRFMLRLDDFSIFEDIFVFL